jgi:hypothetical protein
VLDEPGVQPDFQRRQLNEDIDQLDRMPGGLAQFTELSDARVVFLFRGLLWVLEICDLTTLRICFERLCSY